MNVKDAVADAHNIESGGGDTFVTSGRMTLTACSRLLSRLIKLIVSYSERRAVLPFARRDSSRSLHDAVPKTRGVSAMHAIFDHIDNCAAKAR